MKFCRKDLAMCVHLNYAYFRPQIFKQQFATDIKRDQTFIFKRDAITISIIVYFAKSLVSARSCYVTLT